MKSLNIKKIAFASALVAGSLFVLQASAQTNLITSITPNNVDPGGGGTTGGPGTYSGGVFTSTASPNAVVSGQSNTFTLVNGTSYTFSFSTTASVSNNTRGGALTGTQIYAGSSAIALTGATSQTFVSSLATGNYRLWLNYTILMSTFSLSSISLVDSSAPAPSSGPSLANTQASVANSAQALQGAYALQNSVLANSFAYDCNLFGENNVCVSGGARNTGVSAANGLNNTSALLIAAYRALPSVRIGAYADQNLSVNNGGSTVNLGNNTPLIGLFAAWNERQDGTGSELKVSAAYGQKNTTVNRGVVGSGSTASEAGSGSSQLNSQGFQVLGKHGFGVMQDVVVSPYVGIRYTQNNMGGYTEGSSATVTAPLTYSALNTNSTTALAGVGASYRGIPKTNLFASAGVESDTNTTNGSYNATGVTGLTPVNFNANPVKTRATATLGATYDVEKNQRLGITGIYRQESYQAVSTTSVMATYTVGF
jgi:hypothetical protein